MGIGGPPSVFGRRKERRLIVSQQWMAIISGCQPSPQMILPDAQLPELRRFAIPRFTVTPPSRRMFLVIVQKGRDGLGIVPMLLLSGARMREEMRSNVHAVSFPFPTITSGRTRRAESNLGISLQETAPRHSRLRAFGMNGRIGRRVSP